MISNTKKRRDTKKDYRPCLRCKSPVFDILRSNEKHDSIITVDLNHKRHICTGPERIIHEENIVKGLQRHNKNTNELELLSFQLGLIMEEAAST
ncbi:MAG: hypothetical protein WBQ16_11090 [Nitrososphaeraceae archaeon]